MQENERNRTKAGEHLAHARPLVERCLVLTGLVPLPAFLVLHLTRELWLGSPADVSELIRAPREPLSQLTSVLLVWLPLAIHAALGAWLLVTRRRLRFGDRKTAARWTTALSRWTGAFALLFILQHAREYPLAVLLGEADARDAGLRSIASLSATQYGFPLRSGFYLLGLAATATHAALGVHSALSALGVVKTERGRALSRRACAATGAAVFALGAAAVIRVATGVLLR